MPHGTGRITKGNNNNNNKLVEKKGGISTPSSARSFRPSSNLFRTRFDVQSESREMDRIWCRLYLRQTVSMCLVLRVEPLWFGHTQRCRGITAQNLLCRLTRLLGIAPKLQQPVPLLSQAQRVQRPTQLRHWLSAIVDCFLLDAVIGYQPTLPRNHDAVPLTLNRSPSPALSESPYVNTEPTGALFTASRLSVVGRTVVPGSTKVSQD